MWPIRIDQSHLNRCNKAINGLSYLIVCLCDAMDQGEAKRVIDNHSNKSLIN